MIYATTVKKAKAFKELITVNNNFDCCVKVDKAQSQFLWLKEVCMEIKIPRMNLSKIIWH